MFRNKKEAAQKQKQDGTAASGDKPADYKPTTGTTATATAGGAAGGAAGAAAAPAPAENKPAEQTPPKEHTAGMAAPFTPFVSAQADQRRICIRVRGCSRFHPGRQACRDEA